MDGWMNELVDRACRQQQEKLVGLLSRWVSSFAIATNVDDDKRKKRDLGLYGRWIDDTGQTD